ncbi:FCD domain-containing protein [Patulibacter sp. NPDC049589]|uniref:FadR/GntR family transcriptional regulator n=1 Tax=Patulibacter sp. NPDC049589 TaxID=3154731 RepID=UPI00344A2691
MSAPSAPGQPARAYEVLAGELRRRIESGELAVGARLPSEIALAEQESVSRSTVREALRTLQEAGLVRRPSPRVLVVAPEDARSADEVHRALRRSRVTFRDLHEALLVFEPAVTRLATERADPVALRGLAANLRAQEAHLNDFEEWNRLDQEFHLSIAEASGNPALLIARSPITDLLLPMLGGFMVSPKLTARALRFHHRILEEMQVGDAEAAALMTRKHVDDFRRGWELAGLDMDLEVGAIDAQVVADVGRAAAAGL